MAKSVRKLVEATLTKKQVQEANDETKKELRKIAISELRKFAGISQMELGRRMGVSQPAISKIERQSSLSVPLIVRVMAALGGSASLKVDLPPSDEHAVGLHQTIDLVEVHHLNLDSESSPTRTRRRAKKIAEHSTRSK